MSKSTTKRRIALIQQSIVDGLVTLPSEFHNIWVSFETLHRASEIHGRTLDLRNFLESVSRRELDCLVYSAGENLEIEFVTTVSVQSKRHWFLVRKVSSSEVKSEEVHGKRKRKRSIKCLEEPVSTTVAEIKIIVEPRRRNRIVY